MRPQVIATLIMKATTALKQPELFITHHNHLKTLNIYKDSIRSSITNILVNYKQDIAKLVTDNFSPIENAKTTCLDRIAFSRRKVLEIAKIAISKKNFIFML